MLIVVPTSTELVPELIPPEVPLEPDDVPAELPHGGAGISPDGALGWRVGITPPIEFVGSGIRVESGMLPPPVELVGSAMGVDSGRGTLLLPVFFTGLSI